MTTKTTKTVQIIEGFSGFEVRADYTVKARFANYWKAKDFAKEIANGRKIVEKTMY